MKLDRNLKIDLIVLAIHLLISPFLVLYFELSFTLSTLVYFLLPSIYLIARRPRAIHESIGASILIGLILGTWADIFNEISLSWEWPHPEKFFLPYFLGIVPGDVILWLSIWVFQIIVFYEHFFKHRHTGGFSPRWKKGLLIALLVLILTSIIYLINPLLLNIPYSYFIFGISALLISCWIIYHHPKYIRDFCLVSIYFIPLYLIFEYTAIKLGNWAFIKGTHLANIKYAGSIIAIEELVFWVILSSTIILSYYKWWVDDEK